ncbi:hypothetical protein DFH09DRAFT_1127999 [Mycena vulgaris]|nr:hypothetical protein DFH09DRAFT_1127999 [Mycena vulgaris]
MKVLERAEDVNFSTQWLVFCWLGLARKPWLWLGFVWLWLSIFQARAKAGSKPGQARASGLSQGLSGKFSRSSS